jgi:hypothetical protein
MGWKYCQSSVRAARVKTKRKSTWVRQNKWYVIFNGFEGFSGKAGRAVGADRMMGPLSLKGQTSKEEGKIFESTPGVVRQL